MKNNLFPCKKPDVALVDLPQNYEDDDQRALLGDPGHEPGTHRDEDRRDDDTLSQAETLI